jgi:hypothetical protein
MWLALQGRCSLHGAHPEIEMLRQRVVPRTALIGTNGWLFGGVRACPRNLLLRAGLFCALTSMLVGCTSAQNIRNGMSESELIALLGPPDRRVADEDSMKLFSTDEHCPTDVKQVWVYERLVRDDVLVGLNADRRVRCAWDASVFEIIT